MDYQKHYNLLIERAKSRLLEGYSERHHIVPRCMGGSDDPDNLVRLTPEEHFVAHQLLVKIYPGHHGLICAVIKMTGGYRRSNKVYGWLRTKLSKTMSVFMKGRQVGDKNGMYGQGHKVEGTKNGMYGKTHSEETIDKIKEKRKKQINIGMEGRSHTNESRKKISEAVRNNHPTKGKTYEEAYGEEKARELRKSRSESNKNRQPPMLGKKHSENTKEKMKKSSLGKASKFIYIIEDKELFLTEIAEKYNIHRDTVVKRCISENFPEWTRFLRGEHNG
jgi:hypothetical protein